MFVNARQLRIHILDLQDEHCQSCPDLSASYTYCYANYPVGKRIRQYGMQLSTPSGKSEQNKSRGKKEIILGYVV
ncbi:hypothetical protein [Bacillus toyonensis]|uniref:hypothetical protein n=1 Tax=Bacillus toyonensis TaxID=155322 RepID=UPI000BFE73CD|nr:hypothetical protein [Bacillus toyonensis]PHG59262.1 hypothetical protein COI59_27345 [Bacillus toyonensis]